DRCEPLFPRSQHKCVRFGIKSSEFRLRHKINMDEAGITFRKGHIANDPYMEESRATGLFDRRLQKVAALSQRPGSDKEQRKLVARIISLDAWKHREIHPIRILEQLGVGGWIAAKALLHVQ